MGLACKGFPVWKTVMHFLLLTPNFFKLRKYSFYSSMTSKSGKSSFQSQGGMKDKTDGHRGKAD